MEAGERRLEQGGGTRARLSRSRKIVAIGAGGSEFVLKTLPGLLRTPGLRGVELVLVDVDAEKLAASEAVAQRMNREWKAEMTISATTERMQALGDAGFVFLSVAVDREDSWRRDHELALRYGITHYAECGGPGAFAHACRNLSLIVPILRDVERLAPGALVIAFTNPLSRICTAVQRLTDLAYVGVCPVIEYGYFILATILHDELGLELPDDARFRRDDAVVARYREWSRAAKERVAIKAAGLNHFTWILGVRDRHTGEDLYPLVRRKAGSLTADFEPLTRRLHQIFGLLPLTGDEHVTEFLPCTADAREGTWERFGIRLYDFEWSKARRLKRLAFIREAASGAAPIEHLRSGASDRTENIISAVLEDARTFEESVNVRNGGSIANLPADAVVEVPGLVDADGVAGTNVGELPEAIAALCRTQIAISELNVEAHARGSRALAHRLFALDPMIQDPDVAVRLADEYIETCQGSFPHFA